MVVNPESAAIQFTKVLQKLDDLHWLTREECDVIISQDRDLVAFLNRDHHIECEEFDEEKTRLDSFFTALLVHQKEKYQSLWKVFLVMFTLSHGQAAVEKGFSTNKDVEMPNLKKETLVAQRLVHNALLANGVTNASLFYISSCS